MRYLLLSVLVVCIIGFFAIPQAFADATVTHSPGSSTPGCEETNSCFIPSTVTIQPGSTVTWKNTDNTAHTATSGTAADGPDGVFDSSLMMANGPSFSHTFDAAGTYDYFCMVHPWMAGSVIVGAGSSTPSQPPPGGDEPAWVTSLEQQSTPDPEKEEVLKKEEPPVTLDPETVLQKKLDEYWNCAYMLDSKLAPDCINASLPSTYNLGVEKITRISVYGVYCDPVCRLAPDDFTDDEENYFTHFPVENKLKKFQNENLHQQLFNTYVSITPPQILDEVSAFYIETDDWGTGADASVDRLYWLAPPYDTKFYVSIDPADMIFNGAVDEQYLKPTLIHENAHILSLSENQGDNNGLPPEAYDKPSLFKQLMTEGERSCANYYDDLAGCMNKNSYLNAFFQKFWAGIYRDHNWEWEYDNVDNFYNHNSMFYEKYSSHFVIEYAASNPDEDFAESFTAFVLKEPTVTKWGTCNPYRAGISAVAGSQPGMMPKQIPFGPQFCDCEKKVIPGHPLGKTMYWPSGCGTATLTIQDQKKNFFYQYDELKEMRSFIRNAIATSEFCDGETVWNGKTCVKPVSPPPQQQTQQSKGGGCLIATAAFGSEMAPQVQFLREIRDNTVLQTESGTSFMTGFNQFYYSFSPTIADYERENPTFKEAVKITLTPLLTSLTLLQYADIDSESEMLGYGIGIILLNIGMYFVVPAVLIMKVRKKI